MANVPYKDIAPIKRVLWLVSVYYLNLALKSLSTRMGEIQREVVLSVDLPARINENTIHDIQCAQVAASACISIICIFVRLASNLFTMAFSCLFLEG